MDFAGKVALVTGGAQGIGRAYCSALLNVGIKVCLCDVNKDAAQKFIGSLSDDIKHNIIFQKCDVTIFQEFKDAFDKVISVFGRIDLVINNAGIYNEINFEKMVQINFVAVIYGIKLGFEYMGINNGGFGGFIVNTASIGGLKEHDIAPVYSGCKHGVVGLTKSFGTDLHFKNTGVRVSALCPEGVETNLTATCTENLCISSTHKEEIKQRMEKRTLMRPEDVASALLRILADGKNGALLRVDTTSGLRYVTTE